MSNVLYLNCEMLHKVSSSALRTRFAWRRSDRTSQSETLVATGVVASCSQTPVVTTAAYCCGLFDDLGRLTAQQPQGVPTRRACVKNECFWRGRCWRRKRLKILCHKPLAKLPLILSRFWLRMALSWPHFDPKSTPLTLSAPIPTNFQPNPVIPGHHLYVYIIYI